MQNIQQHKNETRMKFSINIIGDDETTFPLKLLLTQKRVSNVRNTFTNNSAANLKLSTTQIYKIVQSGRFLD